MIATTFDSSDMIRGAKTVDLSPLSPPAAMVIPAGVEVVTTLTTARRQAQREAKLVGKKVIMVCCGLDGLDSKKFTFARSGDLGVRVILVEDPSNTLARDLEDSKFVERWVKVDMTPRESLLQDCVSALREVEGEIGGFDGVCSFWDDAITLMARIGREFKLPLGNVESFDIAHDKNRTRVVLDKAGVPTPRHMLLKNKDDAIRAMELVGAPAIIKPMSGGSSLGVLRVETAEEIPKVYDEVVKMVLEFHEEGELMGINFDAGVENHFVVIEEYLDGPEVDVDLLLHEGEVTYAVVCDDWPQIEPWYAEWGNNCPSILPESDQRSLKEMAVQCVKAMGFTSGLFHSELKLTSKGPRLIEVNPRMGGGPVWAMHRKAFGVDLITEQLFASVGLPATPPQSARPQKCVSCGEKFFDKSLTIQPDFVTMVDAIRGLPGVVESEILVQVGEKVVGIQDGFPTRCSRVIVTSSTPAKAQDYAQSLLRMSDFSDCSTVAPAQLN